MASKIYEFFQDVHYHVKGDIAPIDDVEKKLIDEEVKLRKLAGDVYKEVKATVERAV